MCFGLITARENRTGGRADRIDLAGLRNEKESRVTNNAYNRRRQL